MSRATAWNASLGQRLSWDPGVDVALLPMNYNRPYTLMGWKKSNTTVGYFNQVWQVADAQNTNNMDILYNSADAGGLQCYVSILGSWTGATVGSFSTGWEHVAQVRASIETIHWYLNGRLLYTHTRDVTTRTSNFKGVEFGHTGFGAGDWGSYNGSIQCAKLWKAALSADEIVREMWSVNAVRRSDLIAVWPMAGDTDAERIVDISGNGRNLVAGGTLASSDGIVVPWTSRSYQRSIAELAAQIQATGYQPGFMNQCI